MTLSSVPYWILLFAVRDIIYSHFLPSYHLAQSWIPIKLILPIRCKKIHGWIEYVLKFKTHIFRIRHAKEHFRVYFNFSETKAGPFFLFCFTKWSTENNALLWLRCCADGTAGAGTLYGALSRAVLEASVSEITLYWEVT